MPKIISYMICHYGLDYIKYALQSVEPSVEKMHIVYTPYPSHGHRVNDLGSIESGQDILQEIFQLKNQQKIAWSETHHSEQEGQHRDLSVSLCEKDGAELILVVDCDEVWPAEMLQQTLEYVWKENSARNWCVNMTHLWKSFNWCCRDHNWPVRILDTRHSDGTAFIPKEFGDVYHFGYATTNKLMRYKWEIHGHKYELRDRWIQDTWEKWEPGINDVHPTNERDFWIPERFDKTLLPKFMRDHPFYNLEIIR